MVGGQDVYTLTTSLTDIVVMPLRRELAEIKDIIRGGIGAGWASGPGAYGGRGAPWLPAVVAGGHLLPPMTESLAARYLSLLRRARRDGAASWRGPQASMMHVLSSIGSPLHGQSVQDALIVAGTSSGKSTVLYPLVLGEENGLTVVVLFTVALEEDYVRRGEEMGVRVTRWRDIKDEWRQEPGVVGLTGLVCMRRSPHLCV